MNINVSTSLVIESGTLEITMTPAAGVMFSIEANGTDNHICTSPTDAIENLKKAIQIIEDSFL